MKDRKIKYIDIVYENCEIHRLKPDMFSGLIIRNITKEYCINCFQYEKGEVNQFINCTYFSIFINKKGMAHRERGLQRDTLRKRIKDFKDITHVDLFFTNGTNEYISVPWGGDNYENEKQKVEFGENEISIIIEK
ncbi:MAG: hypothetical protein ABIK92_04585 [Pseudomonadota bacterium]